MGLPQLEKGNLWVDTVNMNIKGLVCYNWGVDSKILTLRGDIIFGFENF